MLRVSPYAWNDKIQAAQYAELRVAWKITGAKAVTLLNVGFPVANDFDTGLNTLAKITALLPNMTADEFVAATAFGSTAMGTDAFGFVIDMDGTLGAADGQARQVIWVTCHVSGTASSVPLIASFAGQSTALTNALSNQCFAGASGNVAGHIVVTGLDALTSGVIDLSIMLAIK